MKASPSASVKYWRINPEKVRNRIKDYFYLTSKIYKVLFTDALYCVDPECHNVKVGKLYFKFKTDLVRYFFT